MRTGRPKAALVSTLEELSELVNYRRRRKTSHGLATRAARSTAGTAPSSFDSSSTPSTPTCPKRSTCIWSWTTPARTSAPYSQLVCKAAALPPALHAHLRLLVEPGRTLVRASHSAPDQARHASHRARTGEGDQGLYPSPQPRPQALPVGQDRRPDPRQHRPLRPAHSA